LNADLCKGFSLFVCYRSLCVQAAELEALLAAWSQQALQQQQAATAAGSSTGMLLRHGSSLPRSNSSSVAPLLSAPPALGSTAPTATGAAAAAAGGVASSGSIGRVSLSRLSLGLVLDERRLQELLAGGIKVTIFITKAGPGALCG
jgi:hypothetical protein